MSAWVVDGAVDRPIVTVSLAADHRATDGLVGSRFLATIAHRLEHPELPRPYSPPIKLPPSR
ncbi:MAG: 2-oxo acid dehydrogenase subunit E2 [Acidimicrobiales bacterium]